jgi:quercetin dioxygenase-like cupin family protein
MPSECKFEEQKAQQAPISLELACSALNELRSPRVVGQVNKQYIKVAKVLGDFPWHSHEHEDEKSLVLRGLLRIGCAEVDGTVALRPGEFFVVPRGLRHNTSAAETTWIEIRHCDPISPISARV